MSKVRSPPFIFLEVNKLRKIDLTKIDKKTIEEIKRIIIEFSAPIIPFVALFQALGFGGITGIDYATLSGLITACAVELGYKVEKIGRFIILRKEKKQEGKG
jgi:hypothetical protein